MDKDLKRILDIEPLEMASTSYEDVTTYINHLCSLTNQVQESILSWARLRIKDETPRKKSSETEMSFGSGYQLNWVYKGKVRRRRVMCLKMSQGIELSWHPSGNFGSLNWQGYLSSHLEGDPLYPHVDGLLGGGYKVLFLEKARGGGFRHNKRLPSLIVTEETKIVVTEYYLRGWKVPFWRFYDAATTQDKKVLLRDWLHLENEGSTI